MPQARPSLLQSIFAWLLSKLAPAIHKFLDARKREAFAEALKGQVSTVVEVGIGSGQNMQYYAQHPGIAVTGIDPNGAFREYSIKNAEKNGLTAGRFTWMQGTGENLPLPDNCCDALITTLVLCSVTDMDKCLKEVQRVVRPGGKFLFLEHIGARPGGILRALQRTFNPAWKRTFEGCNLNRDTLIHIKQSGFTDVKAQEFGWTWHAAAIQPLLLPIMAIARPLCIGVATV